jgi:YggT family protein
MGLSMGVDLSPLVVIVAIWFLQIAVVQSIKDLAIRMN